MNFITQAITNLLPVANKGFSIQENNIETIDWFDNSTYPTTAEIQAEIDKLQAEYDAQEYARNRSIEYPAIGDQLDDLFHAGAFSAEMSAKLQAVKDRHPK